MEEDLVKDSSQTVVDDQDWEQALDCSVEKERVLPWNECVLLPSRLSTE